MVTASIGRYSTGVAFRRSAVSSPFSAGASATLQNPATPHVVKKVQIGSSLNASIMDGVQVGRPSNSNESIATAIAGDAKRAKGGFLF